MFLTHSTFLQLRPKRRLWGRRSGEWRTVVYQGETTFSRSDLTAQRSRISSTLLSPETSHCLPSSGTTQPPTLPGLTLPIIWLLKKNSYRLLSLGNIHFHSESMLAVVMECCKEFFHDTIFLLFPPASHLVLHPITQKQHLQLPHSFLPIRFLGYLTISGIKIDR